MRPGDDAFQILQTLSGELAVLPSASARMPETRRLITALLDVIPAHELVAWLQTPNQGFDGRSPCQLLKTGERDLIWEMLYQTRHEAFA